MPTPRRPDWRWAEVVQLAQGVAEYVALARLKNKDELMRRAYVYKRSLDSHRGIVDTEVDTAYGIFMNGGAHRLIIESYLLAGAEPSYIAEMLEMTEDEVRVYDGLFFDVLCRIHNRPALSAMLFNGFPHAGAHLSDRLGLAHRIAYLGGLSVIDGIIRGDRLDALPEMYAQLGRNVAVKQAMEVAFTLSASPESIPDAMRILGEATKTDQRGGKDADLEELAETFMSSLTMSVADPTQAHNLELPARELREHEYKVTPNEQIALHER